MYNRFSVQVFNEVTRWRESRFKSFESWSILSIWRLDQRLTPIVFLNQPLQNQTSVPILKIVEKKLVEFFSMWILSRLILPFWRRANLLLFLATRAEKQIYENMFFILSNFFSFSLIIFIFIKNLWYTKNYISDLFHILNI